MGSTPGTAANKDKDSTNTPDSSGSKTTANEAGAGPRALKKKAAGKKKSTASKTARKAVVKKAATRKKAASKKSAVKKSVSSKADAGKATGKKAASKKTSGKKTAAKKVATRKTASRTAASKKTAAGRKPASRSRKRPGLAGVSASTSPDTGTVAENATAATSGDPRSLSWMAASAVNALNAVKAHQAEKASQIRDAHDAGSPGVSTEPDDGTGIDALAPAASTPDSDRREAATDASVESSPARVSAESEASLPPVTDTRVDADTGADAVPAEIPETPPVAEETESADAGVVSADPGRDIRAPDIPETPLQASEQQESGMADVEDGDELADISPPAMAAESSGESTAPDMPGAATESVDAPLSMASEEAVQDEPSDEMPVLDDASITVPDAASQAEEQASVAEIPDAGARDEVQDAPSPDEEASTSATPASKVTSPPPPPPASRQGIPVRMIVAAVVLGLAVLFGYRFMGDDHEVAEPVANLPGEDSPITGSGRPAISAVPVVVDTASTETGEDAEPLPQDDSATLAATAVDTPPAADPGVPETTDVPAQSGIAVTAPAVTTAPAQSGIAVTAPAVTAAPAQSGISTTAPAVNTAEEQTLVQSEESSAPSDGGAAMASPDDAIPDAVAQDPVQPDTNIPEAAPAPVRTAPSRRTAPVSRQPAYRAPGYGYYPPGWQQPAYRYPARQSPPERQ